ncbi:MAG: nitroreductase family protein [Betaproteobacteria bacterium]
MTPPAAPYADEPLPAYPEVPPAEMIERANGFLAELRRRRTVRDFDRRPVPREVIEACLLAAGTAPSGANQQPWFFSVVNDPRRKRRIREAAEQEEREFYGGKAPQEWLDALAPLGTDPNKPFLEDAPVLIAIFAQKCGVRPDGSRFSHYYVPESVGIAAGFLNGLCERPASEKPVILLVVGSPKSGCRVPVQGGIKKPLDRIAAWL